MVPVFVPNLLYHIYKNYPKFDKTKIAVYLLDSTEQGKTSNKVFVTANFNRNLYNTLNWQSKNPDDVLLKFPNLIVLYWFIDKLHEEGVNTKQAFN